MDLDTELLQQVAGLYIFRDVCTGIAILFAFLFMLFFAFALCLMAKRPTRRNQGLSQLMTSLSVAALMLAFVPAVAIPVIDIQIDHVEKSWGYDQIDIFENEYNVKVPKGDREKVAVQFVQALSADGTLLDNGTEKLGTIIIDSAIPAYAYDAYTEGDEESEKNSGKFYYTISLIDANASNGFSYPSGMDLSVEIEKSPSRGV